MPSRFRHVLGTRSEEAVPAESARGVNYRILTTAPTTGLLKGDSFLVFHGSVPRIAVCTSTAAQTVRFVRLRTKTNGRLTA
mgnify:CR=1 FL=1